MAEEERGGSIFRKEQDIIVTDIQMPFGSMVVFMVKWTLASIPAVMILFVVGALFVPALLGIAAALRALF